MSAQKRGLGRGLEALLEKKPESAVVTTLPLGRLRPNRFQPRSRFDSPDLAELAASIKAQGLVQPIVVTPRNDGDYTIVAGERRWRAARQAGLEQIPVTVREVAGDRELLELALVENLQRTDLDPVEQAEAYQRLSREFGLGHEEIAAKVGKSRAAVSNTLRLLGLPEEVLELLRTGRLTAGQARPLLGLGSAEDQTRAANQIVKNNLSAREVEQLAARRKSGSADRKAPRLDPDTQAAADRLTRRLNTKVEISRRGQRGKVVISFHSEEELIRLYDILIQAGGQRK